MKTITLRTKQKAADMLTENYGNASRGAGIACESYPYLRIYTLNEIRGIFNDKEISAMVDSMNALIFQAEIMSIKGVLIAHLENAEKFENLSTKWNIDISELSNKIRLLTSAQAFFLQDEIRRFWNIPEAYGSPNPDLDKLITALC